MQTQELDRADTLAKLEDMIARNAKPGDELEGAFPPYVVEALEQAAVALRLLDMIGERPAEAPGPRVLIVTSYNSGYLLRDGVTLEEAAPVLAGAIKITESYGTWREEKGHMEIQTIPRGHKSIKAIEAEEIMERGRQHEAADTEARLAFERTDDYRLAVKLGEEAAIMGMGFPDCPYKGEEEPGLTFGWILGYRGKMNAQAKEAEERAKANVSRGEDVEKRIAEGAPMRTWEDPNADPFARGRDAAIAGHDCVLNPYDFATDTTRAMEWAEGFGTVEQEEPASVSEEDRRPLMPAGQSISVTTDGVEVPLTRNAAPVEIVPIREATAAYLEGRAAWEMGTGRLKCPYCGVGMPKEKSDWLHGYDDAELGIVAPDVAKEDMAAAVDDARIEGAYAIVAKELAEGSTGPDGFGGEDFPPPAKEEKEDPEGGY